MKKLYFLLFCLMSFASFGQIVINEVDADQTGTDTAEFIELKWTPNTALDGFVVVLFNGSDDLSYMSYDLDGKTTDANGFFILANATTVGFNASIDITLPSNGLQNGADGVAVYQASDTDFPNDTAITLTNLIDVLIYGTSDSDDTGLLTGFGETVQYNDTGTESIQRKADGTYLTQAITFRAENFSSDPTIIVGSALTNLSYSVGGGPSAEQTFTVEGTNLTADITVTAPANFEISTTSGSSFGASISLRQNAGVVASTPIYTRLVAGLAINTYSGDVTLSSTGASNKTVSLSGGVFGALTNAMVITGVFDPTATTPRGVELMALKNIPDLSVFGVESANNGGGASGQEFTFPVGSATAGDYIYLVATGQEADFAAFFGTGFSTGNASGAMFINGNDAIVLYENTLIIDVFGEPTVDGAGSAWDYTDGWAYRNANTGPSTTFIPADWQLGNTAELDGAINSGSSTAFPIKTYQNTLAISKQQLLDGFALYPNPLRGGLLNIQSPSNTVKNINIFDVIGQQVYHRNTTKNQINISNLNAGMYFVKVQQDGKIATRKLVVE